MWEPPDNVEQTTRLIVEAGIGFVAFKNSFWPRSFSSEIVRGRDIFGECMFWVQVDYDPIANTGIKQVVMRHPDVTNVEVFTAERGLGFEACIWPLESHQQRVIDSLASEWLQTHRPTRNTRFLRHSVGT